MCGSANIAAQCQEAIASLGLQAEITQITDPQEFIRRGVLATPALIVNGRIVCRGQVIKSAQIQPLLQ